ncbi:MAG: hypothetical protein HOJ54_03470 [Phycisphaerae bacterium]|nr:hypothetical protein [Phycisphaerae bacterium]
MSDVVHLVTGGAIALRPTHRIALNRCVQRRGDRVVALGSSVPGAEAIVPMPGRRIGIAGRIFEAWCDERMDRGVPVVAWDIAAMCVASESMQPVIGVIDGVVESGALTRCAATLVQSGEVPLVGASNATMTRLGAAVHASHRGEPSVPAAVGAAARGDEPLRITILAEPAGIGAMLPYAGVVGRLHLLGNDLSVRVVGPPSDARHGCQMFADMGLSDVSCCQLDALHWASGDIALCVMPLMSSRCVSPARPAIAAWAAGANIVVPCGHPACDWLAGRGGVLISADGHSDEVVRWISQSHAEGGEDRAAVLQSWHRDDDHDLDATILAATH